MVTVSAASLHEPLQLHPQVVHQALEGHERLDQRLHLLQHLAELVRLLELRLVQPPGRALLGEHDDRQHREDQRERAAAARGVREDRRADARDADADAGQRGEGAGRARRDTT